MVFAAQPCDLWHSTLISSFIVKCIECFSIQKVSYDEFDVHCHHLARGSLLFR